MVTPPQEPRTRNRLLVVLVASLIVLGGLSGFLYWQVRSLEGRDSQLLQWLDGPERGIGSNYYIDSTCMSEHGGCVNGSDFSFTVVNDCTYLQEYMGFSLPCTTGVFPPGDNEVANDVLVIDDMSKNVFADVCLVPSNSSTSCYPGDVVYLNFSLPSHGDSNLNCGPGSYQEPVCPNATLALAFHWPSLWERVVQGNLWNESGALGYTPDVSFVPATGDLVAIQVMIQGGDWTTLAFVK